MPDLWKKRVLGVFPPLCLITLDLRQWCSQRGCKSLGFVVWKRPLLFGAIPGWGAKQKHMKKSEKSCFHATVRHPRKFRLQS